MFWLKLVSDREAITTILFMTGLISIADIGTNIIVPIVTITTGITILKKYKRHKWDDDEDDDDDWDDDDD